MSFNITVLTPDMPAFPDRLRNIPDPPMILYAMGDIRILNAPAVAIVGTREPSEFGARSARKIAARLAADGRVIVSGLALGIDAAAHRGCLDVGGYTVAVLAHGLDRNPIYPAQNNDLAHAILDNGGCLLSEYPAGAKPCRDLFVWRDRLQPGLSDGTIVCETDVKGGTMHTVRFCRAQRRPLGCIAHPPKFAATTKARGNQMLIAAGHAVALPDKDAIEQFIRSL